MNVPAEKFIIDTVTSQTITGKKVIEIGSRNVNDGQIPLCSKLVVSLFPEKYVKADYESGNNVDVVLNANDIVNEFGAESFDTILSFEMLEHVENWKYVVKNMKRIIRPNGYIITTTRSYGFPMHNTPSDYWRYEIEDFISIFSDMKILILVRDWSGYDSYWNGKTMQIDKSIMKELPLSIDDYLGQKIYPEPGIFMLAQKPENFIENLLDGIKLYNMLADKRV